MADEIITRVMSKPGIKRDGTRLEGDAYVDGEWCRFQRGLPRKIGGYRVANRYLRGVTRTLHAYTENGLTYLHTGSATAVQQLYIDGTYNTSNTSDRTPATLAASAANMWQFDTETYSDPNTGIFTNKLVAQVAPNLNCICNNLGGQLFVGDLLGTAPLQELTIYDPVSNPTGTLPDNASVTGGVVSLHPYTLAFGNSGYVMWSVPTDPGDFIGSGSGYANVTGQKIVRGMPLRGGPGNAPSGLLWSADSLLRVSFVGQANGTFQFDTISAQSSILSAQCVIEYDGIFYWVGVDRFLMFNGVVRDIPNEMNTNFFFDNLNMAQRQKVFATKVPRFGEIWWCFPKGDSLEPNHAVIYNVRENSWYDTPLHEGGRGAAIFPTVFNKPLMTGVLGDPQPVVERITEGGDTRITESGDTRITEQSGTLLYKLWVHEVGVDAIDGQDIYPIRSFFETADISLPVQQGINRALQVLVMEPDFVQSGDMTVEVHGRANARSPEVNSPPLTIYETPPTPQDQTIRFKEQRRELRFLFESNCLGGDYQMGHILVHLQPGDGTVIG